MAALTEARLTGVAVGSAPGMALKVVVVMLAGPRGIGVGAVEPFHWPTYAESRCLTPILSFERLHEFSQMRTTALTRRLDDRHDLDLFIGAERQQD